MCAAASSAWLMTVGTGADDQLSTPSAIVASGSSTYRSSRSSKSSSSGGRWNSSSDHPHTRTKIGVTKAHALRTPPSSLSPSTSSSLSHTQTPPSPSSWVRLSLTVSPTQPSISPAATMPARLGDHRSWPARLHPDGCCALAAAADPSAHVSASVSSRENALGRLCAFPRCSPCAGASVAGSFPSRPGSGRSGWTTAMQRSAYSGDDFDSLSLSQSNGSTNGSAFGGSNSSNDSDSDSGNGSSTAGQGDGPPFRVNAPGQRIIAIGDVHGDIESTKAALRLGGVLSPEEDKSAGQWVGGSTIVVQLGDILDRGADEIAILSLLHHLDKQARSMGGAVYQLNGNHETLNVAEDFRYVVDGGYLECDDFAHFANAYCGGDWQLAFRDWWAASQSLKDENRRRHAEHERGWGAWNPLTVQRRVRLRHELFEVGGPIATQLSRHGVALLINNTLFAHGGVLPHHIEYGLERMNVELSRWMRGSLNEHYERSSMPFIATRGFDSVVWTRLYSRETYNTPEERYMACALLATALDTLGAQRLVVGHTPQMQGANSECNGRVWRIDVGMSSGMMGAPPQVLEIDGDEVRVLVDRSRRLPMQIPFL